MRPNATTLAMRDPALAALMGAWSGGNFGSESPGTGQSDFGTDGFGRDFAFAGDASADFAAEFGADDMGADSWGADFGAAAPLARRPTPAAAIAAWHKVGRQTARTDSRVRLLEPNSGSTVKVQRYSFSVNQALVMGTAAAITASGNPDTTIRPQRVTMNAPAAGFITVTEIKVANVAVTVGGIGDAFEYSPIGVDMSLDMPTLSPANRATVLGFYTGFVPPGFVLGSAYTFAASFKGPATIVA